MKKLKFLFGIHCHQPVGNLEQVFDEAYQRAYLPFLETLAKHPRIKFAVHYSGVLYDWFKAKHPEFLELIQKLAKRGQLEILSGGYYEPILSVIPDVDKLGQIELSNKFIKENIWRAPQGMWLTERVWEPSLPKILSQAGIEFTLVDDDLFKKAGLKSEDLFGYYVTEDEGAKLKVLPIQRRLRELITFHSNSEIEEYFKSIPNPKGESAVVFMDDGEKFGLRPETHKWIYEDGYLEKFLTMIEDNADWLESISLSEYLEEYEPLGRIYLPTGSYAEMEKWASPADNDAFNGQGYFRNFFVKYPEANNMHKKMLHVSNKLQTLSQGKSLFGGQRKEEELKQAKLQLFQGQCNCAYWHGLFGGLYLNYLRHAVYASLISAEKELEHLSRGNKPFVELLITDLDKDGADEVVLSNSLINLYFSPKQGGSLYELDYKPKNYNLLNILSRKREKYHSGEQIYDDHLKHSLVDHFLARETDLESFIADQHREVGDFIGQPYFYMPKRSQSELGLKLSREGRVEGARIKVEKNISLFAKQSIFTIEYDLTNLGAEPDEFWFAAEFNLSLLAGRSEDRYYLINDAVPDDKTLSSTGESAEVRVLKLVDEWSGFEVSLEMSQPALLWRFPIETRSQSELGLEKIYQGSTIMPSWKFKLGSKDSKKLKISFRIE